MVAIRRSLGVTWFLAIVVTLVLTGTVHALCNEAVTSQLQCYECCGDNSENDREWCKILNKYFFGIGYDKCIAEAVRQWQMCMTDCKAIFENERERM